MNASTGLAEKAKNVEVPLAQAARQRNAQARPGFLQYGQFGDSRKRPPRRPRQKVRNLLKLRPFSNRPGRRRQIRDRLNSHRQPLA
jgi:hypothetical protein